MTFPHFTVLPGMRYSVVQRIVHAALRGHIAREWNTPS